MGREEGGGFRMGNTCIPVADSYLIWQNQYNIVKLNKIKLKKNKTHTKHYKATMGGGLVAQSCPTLSIPWTVACQAPLSMRFPKQA